MRRSEHARLPVIAGVWPFESAGNAEFMANEVPGVSVPARLVARMRSADTPAAAAAEGVSIAREIARAVKDRVQGIQIALPSGRIDAALAVLEGLL
jgi:homocysteine S-methyltransferase